MGFSRTRAVCIEGGKQILTDEFVSAVVEVSLSVESPVVLVGEAGHIVREVALEVPRHESPGRVAP